MRLALLVAAAVGIGVGVVTTRHTMATAKPPAHDDHDHAPASGGLRQAPGIPASGANAAARLAASPRHGEWVTVKAGADSVVAWVVHPERRDRAPVVVVIHENTGLTTWARGVADQLAADGFIAIAPEMLTMKRSGNLRTDWAGDSARTAIATLTNDDVQRYIDAVAKYAMSLPSAMQKYGIVGFCWGGARSFLHAVHSPSLGASVVYYGSAPSAEQMGQIRAPVLGLYGGNDARITSAVPGVDSTMKRLGKTFEYQVFEGAGHGFLRGQEGAEGANQRASVAAWPKTLAWFRTHLK